MTELYDWQESLPERRAEFDESAKLLHRVGKIAEIAAYPLAVGGVIACKLNGGDEPSPAEWSDIPKLVPYVVPMVGAFATSKLFYWGSRECTKAGRELI